MIAKKLIRAAFRVVRQGQGARCGVRPHQCELSWTDVVAWAAAAGVGLGVAKVVSAHVAAIGWEAATGTLPPGVGGGLDAQTTRASVASRQHHRHWSGGSWPHDQQFLEAEEPPSRAGASDHAETTATSKPPACASEDVCHPALTPVRE